MRDLGEWRPGFYTGFRCASRKHSGLAWGVIFSKMIVKHKIMHFEVDFLAKDNMDIEVQ